MSVRLFLGRCLAALTLMFLGGGEGLAASARFLHEPALRGDSVAFVSANELWVVPLAGGTARQLTSDAVPKAKPRWSPDGTQIAYSAGRPGRRDIYIVPAAGGAPRRVTWNPGNDEVEDWSADGRQLLITSNRRHAQQMQELFLVPARGGAAELIPIGKASRAALSPAGDEIAFMPVRDLSARWRGYRGGLTGRIWIARRSDYAHVEVPHANANDTNPVWLAGKLYFLSDRDGDFGLYVFDPGTRTVEPVLVGHDIDIRWFAGDGNHLVYAESGYLYRYDLRARRGTRIEVTLPRTSEPRFVGDAARLVRNMALAPDGETLAVEARGELFIRRPGQPAVNVTRTSGAAERDPIWSPDGRQIAYLSDESGEYEIHVRTLSGATRRLGHLGGGYPSSLSWSPDGSRIAYIRHTFEIGWVDVQSGRHERLAGPATVSSPIVWGSDSRHFYVLARSPALYGQVVEVDPVARTKRAFTDGMAHVTDMRLSADGGRLFLIASLDAGPVVTDYDVSQVLFAAMPRSAVYTLALGSGASAQPVAESATAGRYLNVVTTSQSVTGRALFLAADGHVLTVQRVNAGGSFYDWFSDSPGDGGASTPPPWAMVRYGPSTSGSLEQVQSPSGDAELGALLASAALQPSAAPNRLLLIADGNPVVVHLDSPGNAVVDRPSLGALPVDVDLASEWRQMYDEVVRRFRDYFHDEGLNRDWPRHAARYRSWLADARYRGDVDFILTHLTREVRNSHIYITPAPSPSSPPGASNDAVGLLGAYLAPRDGHYVVDRIFRSSPWDVTASPLAQANIAEGSLLLAIDGQPISTEEDIDRRLVGKAGQRVALTFSSPGSASPRTIEIRALASDAQLRQLDWFERNRQYVNERSGGRIAYIVQSDTSQGGLAEFIRYFFPQANRAALIVDERFNNGGADPDYQLDVLDREIVNVYNIRGIGLLNTPSSAMTGPRAMLINAEAGSGGDLYPYQARIRGDWRMFGTRTCGCVHGGFRATAPGPFVDGGAISVPDLQSRSPAGAPVLENIGFEPDESIDVSPQDAAAGRDPQLTRTIDYLVGELERLHPQATTQRQ